MLLKKINKTIVCHFILVRIFLLIIFDGEHANKSFFRLLLRIIKDSYRYTEVLQPSPPSEQSPSERAREQHVL